MKKFFRILLFMLVLLLAGSAFFGYKMIWSLNVPEELQQNHVFIKPETSHSDLVAQLSDDGVINNKFSFELVSKLMRYGNGNINVKSGKFKIEGGWSNRDLIKHLRSGNQVPIALTFNNARTTSDMASKIAQQILIDSASLIEYIDNTENWQKWDVKEHEVLTLFNADTYEVYWDCGPKELIDKLVSESNKFWNSDNRKVLCEEIGLTKKEVYTLASIVQKETQKNDEKPRIAGVYMNRLSRGQLLQADPTVVFANKQFDLKRVLNKHLQVDSPFNTYMYAGLPPGPICMPDKTTIDAVLNYEKHNYLYFCAKPNYSGYHNFAKNLIQHNRNASKYHRWLNQEKIK